MPNSTPETKATMMRAVGVSDVDELFGEIPADHLAAEPIALAAGIRSEAVVDRTMRRLLKSDTSCAENLNFLGAGCWQHYVPAVCDEIANRSEFLTPVWGTPSSDHGRNQAWFEFTSQLGELVGMEFVGLPVYSWGAAAGHAIRMAARLTGRREVLVPDTIDPERLAVIRTSCGTRELGDPITVVTVPHDPATGRVDVPALTAAISGATAAVYLETPTYLGVVEADAADIAALARRNGAETIVGVDPISLGVLLPPSEYGADIVVGTTQPLGVHMNAGGGVGGFIATRDEERYAREYPTLQVSLCDTLVPGERAFGMTLFHQTSYGSREEGNDWTGNSVYLWAVVNAVYLALMGPKGFAEIGETILAGSAHAARRIADIPGVGVRWTSGFFKEFVVDFTATGKTVAAVNASLRAQGIFGGKDLSADFPDLGQSALYCVTEIHTEDDITALVGALTEAVSA
ncbi:aminomethyl-transferring glycine dehydrogenase subunit GcvPA [Umezawaea sp. Da 62-37]|uniref:aminomethyl-transferring glycine dehydrogenase subunit GcvPA n=1 Tax=Umezawaea sp. Da 62-37 TaxID=3075927 RepID=UPI0028F71537|nr:aminomethyl-transferring glycine dehydrogenase subunit GcvPA [Umezawaea sp. Da 62-37]WNV85638.1 aminomethyl-transferring glycine dehydrogenase subunit GcvPA [Umezawaea sp. Da 62-37]